MGMHWDALISLGLAQSKSGHQLVKITSSDIETRHFHCSCADQAMSHSEGLVLCIGNEHEQQVPFHFVGAQVTSIGHVGIATRGLPAHAQHTHEFRLSTVRVCPVWHDSS